MSTRIDHFIQDMQIQAKRVDQRFNQIPRSYFWIFGGMFPALFAVSIAYYTHQFVVTLTGLSWVFTMSFITGVVALLFAGCSALIILFGLMVGFVIKDRRERIKQKQRDENVQLIRKEIQSMKIKSDTQEITKQDVTNFLNDLIEKIDSTPDVSKESNSIDPLKIYSAIDKYEELLQQVKDLQQSKEKSEALTQQLYSELTEIKKKLDSKMDK